MTFIQRLFSPCAFSHGDRILTRNRQQQAVWACARCQQELGRVLASEVTSGPLLHQGEVLGQPTAKAKRITPANVAAFRKQGER